MTLSPVLCLAMEQSIRFWDDLDYDTDPGRITRDRMI